VSKVQGTKGTGAPEFEAKKSTDVQILGCKLHQNAFGYSAPPDSLAAIRGMEGGKERKRLGIVSEAINVFIHFH